MTVTYGFYNSVAGDRKYNAEQLSRLFEGIIKDGVFSAIGQNLEVKATTGMNITAGIGRAWFNNTWTDNDALLPLIVPQSEVVMNRIDAVVLEINTNDDARANTIKIVKGTPASNPVAPTMIKTTKVNQYPLAHIAVNANVTTITQANITNKIGTTDCPFVTGLIQQVTTDIITAQWETEFAEWLDYIKGIFVDDPAGHLQTEIESLHKQFTNVSVAVASFVADTTYSGYGYKAVITCTGVTADYKGSVIFAPSEATSGNYAPVCSTGVNTVTIYAKAVPAGAITIPTIFCEKAVSQV